MSKLAATIITGLIIATGVSACGNDATVSGRDTSSAEKINMPDQFDTVATKCSRGFRLFETSSHGVVTAVKDPSCNGSAR
jgi:hypothetical protein